MTRMANNDGDAVFELLEHYRTDLAKSVCSILNALGCRHLSRRRTDVDFLVQGAAIVLFDRAKGWRTDGALPWVWAYPSIRAEVVCWLGHPSVEFDPQFHVATRCDTASTIGIELRELAGEHRAIAGWIDAVEDVANERDQKVHLEYQMQKLLGDRSPANTVSAMFGLSAANVRQIDARVRRRIAARLSGSDIAAVL